MNNLSSKTALALLAIVLSSWSCKIKKQLVANDKAKYQSTTKRVKNDKTTADIVQRSVDSSKTIKKDSTLISVTEKDYTEFDYTYPTPGSPSKITHHFEKTTNFTNGSNITSQTHIMSSTTANLTKNGKKSEVKTKKSDNFSHLSSNITSSSTSWIWPLILLILIVIAATYLVRKFNLINVLKSAVGNVV